MNKTINDNSTAKCEYSRLIIPNETEYARIVGVYATEICKKLGFGDALSAQIAQSVTQVIELLIKYSFEQNERSEIEISFQRLADALKISIHEKGLPVDFATIDSQVSCDFIQSDDSKAERFHCLNDLWDSFEFRNLGPEGKETVLIKKIPSTTSTEHFDSCRPEPFSLEPIATTPRKAPNVVVRRMEENEAIEVAQAIYRTYGYSYGYEQVYYPRKLAALNRTNDIVTAVAIDDSGAVIGTLSILMWDENSAVAEIGQGVVIPSCRAFGIFSKLVEFQIDEATRLGLKGFFGLAVTNHTFSQKTAAKYGSLDCAIILNYIPATVDFKGFDRSWIGRISVVAHYRELSSSGPTTIYPPNNHSSFIQDTYRHLGKQIITISDPDTNGQATCQELHSHLKVLPALKYARITVGSYGHDFMNYLVKTVRELLLHDIEIINLFVNLFDSRTPVMVPRIEELRFFYAGVMPRAAMEGDALVLQYLKGTPINYDEIRIASSFGRKILDYTRKHDPNWQ